MAKGTIRYWAAARAAAGIAEEPYDAPTLAEALHEAREQHGPELSKVLDRCSYVVDAAPVGARDHDTVKLSDGGTVEVLPPFAGGAADAETMTAMATTLQPGRRRAQAPSSGMPVTMPGVAAGLVAGGLAGLALVGTAPLGAGVFVVQVVVALAWLATLDARGSSGAFLIAVGCAAACDIVAAFTDESGVGRASIVLGLAALASLFHQLTRHPRRGVTLSVAATLSACAFALCAASYVSLHVQTGDAETDAASLFGIGVALALARIVDLVLRRPAAVPGSRRGVIGCLLGLGAAAAVGAVYGNTASGVGSDHGLRLAVVAALIALLADLAVDAVLAAAPPDEERSVAALTPLGMLLPVVLAGPAAYVAGRILAG